MLVEEVLHGRSWCKESPASPALLQLRLLLGEEDPSSALLRGSAAQSATTIQIVAADHGGTVVPWCCAHRQPSEMPVVGTVEVPMQQKCCISSSSLPCALKFMAQQIPAV